MKTCNTCKKSKPLQEFKSQKDTTDGLRTWCISCFSDYNKAWSETKSFEYRRNRTLKTRYGITTEDFERMHKEQNGLCAVCEEPFSKVARVEHCHTTKKVRGLVCDGCNLAIAFYERFQQQPEFSERIKKYLDKARI